MFLTPTVHPYAYDVWGDARGQRVFHIFASELAETGQMSLTDLLSPPLAEYAPSNPLLPQGISEAPNQSYINQIRHVVNELSLYLSLSLVTRKIYSLTALTA